VLIWPFAKWTFPRTGPLLEACTAFRWELAITGSTSSTVNRTFQELDPSAGFAHRDPNSVARLYRKFSQITGTLLHKQETILPNHWHSRQFCQITGTLILQFCQITGTGNSAKSLAHSSHIQAILPNHRHRQFCQVTGTLLHPPDTGNSVKSLSTYRQFCQITGKGNSAKSLAHCPHIDNSSKSVEHCPHTGNSAFCLITGNGSSAKSLAKATLPNHWHTPSHTGDNSAKSLALKAGNSAKSLAHSSTYRQFCQIKGTSSTYRQFCQITGTGNSAKSLA
jgi:hypothetical protein